MPEEAVEPRHADYLMPPVLGLTIGHCESVEHNRSAKLAKPDDVHELGGPHHERLPLG